MNKRKMQFEEMLKINPWIEETYRSQILYWLNEYKDDFDAYKTAETEFISGVVNCLDNKEQLIESERLIIKRACINDSDFMSALELDPENTPWIGNWALGYRIRKFGDSDFLQTIIETKDRYPIGFIIFEDMLNKKEQVQLKRIVLREKGKGYGKEALYLSQKLAFEVFNTKQLYLHTRTENIRAQTIYKATGFTPKTPDPCTHFFIMKDDYLS